MRTHGRLPSAWVALAFLALSMLVAVARPAMAQAAGPRWQLESHSVPTFLEPGAPEAQIRVVALNLGDADATPPITISDTLPRGLVATAIDIREGDVTEPPPGECSPLSSPVLSCKWTKTLGGKNEEFPPREEIPPFGRLELIITVRVEAGAGAPVSGELNEAEVQGANTPSASLSQPITVSGASVPFGVEKYELRPENENGSLDTQAGAHPFQMTSVLDFNETLDPKSGVLAAHPGVPELAKDLKFDLPAGLVARAAAVPECSTAQFTEIVEAGQGNLNECAGNTAIGVASVTYFSGLTRLQTKEVPVFNLLPQLGEPARFGFEVSNVPVFLDTAVRTGENYGAEVTVTHASATVEVLSTDVTIWGVPAAKQHNESRGWECLDAGFYEGVERGEHNKECPKTSEEQQNPFLTLPTTCSTPQETMVSGDSWPTSVGHGGQTEIRHELEGPADTFVMPNLTGCDKLEFNPEIKVKPDTHSASTPTGLNVAVTVPQAGILAPGGLAEADIKETTVALPEGLQANPGAANGLAACSAAGENGAGFNGFPSLPESAQLENDHFTSAAVTCPEASKVGKVEIKTPLLANELEGFVYLAEQDTNPFASPLVLYLIAEDPVSGVRVKLAGEVKVEPDGQLVSDFRNTPPQPFETLNLEFFDGQRASQSTPAGCGTYESKATFVSWAGGENAQRSPQFTIGSGPNGTPCPSGALPFSPAFQAGSTINQAYAFTPFTLTIGRPDGEQALKSITMRLPPGLAAMIASVSECPEPAAGQEWACGAESLIGHSTAVSGLGSAPVTLGGRVYFAGPYKGAPFSLVDITPANAGPFHLGNVVVRSTINVDPNTAAATITSDPLPQYVKGVPSQVKALNVEVNRPNFEFNPTNCAEMKIEGTLTGYEGASKEVSSPFQVANCAALPFHPDFTASTSAHTSKTEGASLDVKITYPKGAYANVAKSVTALPYALPSRLTTIQKACPDTVFDANPAGCDAGSVVGEGIVHTPVFKNPLMGPAYLVSHGNRAFPDLEIVLQGEGITLVLDGQTDIKKGITKTSFESVPDAPVEEFELLLPEGPHSALASNDDMCDPTKPETVRKKVTEHVNGRTIHVTKSVTENVAENLVIPTTLTAQNGAVLTQNTKIAVTGCGAVKGSKSKKKATKAKKASKAKKSSSNR